jgi:hypothetical protein|uniref:Lipoprotein n=1 Tax=Desulfobacca acetoxidans TaxID=60893 RepID=A0A7C5EQF8_9BACT
MIQRPLLLITAMAVILGILTAGCGESRDPYVGTYRSLQPYAGKGHIELTLKENGEATWKLEGEKPVKFKWKVAEGHLWLYTREGGIIHVTPSEGNKKLSVDMTGEWNPSCPAHMCLYFERVEVR